MDTNEEKQLSYAQPFIIQKWCHYVFTHHLFPRSKWDKLVMSTYMMAG